jgi:hypothetical protein
MDHPDIPEPSGLRATVAQISDDFLRDEPKLIGADRRGLVTVLLRPSDEIARKSQRVPPDVIGQI